MSNFNERCSQAERFLHALWPQGIPRGKLSVFDKGNKKTKFYGFEEIPAMASNSITEADAAEIYYSVCAMDTTTIQLGRGTGDNVSAIPAFWMDLDYNGEKPEREEYPSQDEVLRLLSEFPLKPSITVHSGNGYHAYFLLDKPFLITDEEERKKARNLSRQLQGCFSEQAARIGKTFDNTSDLPRVLRLPGTCNRKDEANVLPVTTVGEIDDTCRYSVDEIIEAISSLSAKPAGKKKKGGKFYPPLGADGSEPEIKPPPEPIYAGVLDTLKAHGYYIDQEGYLCTLDRDGSKIRHANFVVVPLREVISDDGIEEHRYVVAEGILTGGRVLSEVTVDTDNFEKMSWVVNAWGLKANMMPTYNNKNIVRSAAQSLADGIPVEYQYGHIGWRRFDDNWGYLHAAGCIGQKDKRVVVDTFLQSYCLDADVTDVKEAVKASLKLLDVADRAVTLPLLSLMFLAPLMEPLSQAGIPSSFVLWLSGNTGTRKTTLANLFLSHFRKHTSSPPASFKDTANSLERKAFLTKDSVLLIDDYHPAGDIAEADAMKRTARHILRLYGDRIGRGRLRADCTTRKDYPPRGLAVVTGEDILDGESTLARCINIELGKDGVDLDRLTEAQRTTELLAQSMVGYIQWLIPRMDVLEQILMEEFVRQRATFYDSGVHGRVNNAVIYLGMAFKLFTDYALEAGAVTQEEADVLMAESQFVLDNILVRAAESVENERPEKLFLETLSSCIAAGEYRLDSLNPGCEQTDMFSSGKKIGWLDSQYCYLLPGPTYAAIKTTLKRQDVTFTIKETTLYQNMAKSNIIKSAVEKNGRLRHTHHKVINKNRLRVIFLPVELLDID